MDSADYPHYGVRLSPNVNKEVSPIKIAGGSERSSGDKVNNSYDCEMFRPASASQNTGQLGSFKNDAKESRGLLMLVDRAAGIMN